MVAGSEVAESQLSTPAAKKLKHAMVKAWRCGSSGSLNTAEPAGYDCLDYQHLQGMSTKALPPTRICTRQHL